jgi:hypothetical protein
MAPDNRKENTARPDPVHQDVGAHSSRWQPPAARLTARASLKLRAALN